MYHQVTLQPLCFHPVVSVVALVAQEALAVSWTVVVDIKPWGLERRSRDVV
jgi:hypothetical protein